MAALVKNKTATSLAMRPNLNFSPTQEIENAGSYEFCRLFGEQSVWAIQNVETKKTQTNQTKFVEHLSILLGMKLVQSGCIASIYNGSAKPLYGSSHRLSRNLFSKSIRTLIENHDDMSEAPKSDIIPNEIQSIYHMKSKVGKKCVGVLNISRKTIKTARTDSSVDSEHMSEQEIADLSDFDLTYKYSISFFLTEESKSIHSRLMNSLDMVVDAVEEFSRPHIRKISFINVTKYDGFQLTERDLPEDKSIIDLAPEFYENDFVEVSKNMVERLNTRPTGLTLLHGKPGTGKTSYIRYLLGVLKKRCIYMPPFLASSLSDPSFVTFMQEQAKDSVLIIEDAETILQTRDAGHNSAVSNILNLADGLFGDTTRIQIVCTVNCDRAMIDPALLRPGRLMAEYEFGLLSKEKTIEAVQKVHGTDVVPKKDRMTIADVFHGGEHVSVLKPVVSKQKIGFL